MALNKLAAKRTRSTSTAPAANAPASVAETETAAPAADIATLQQVLAKVVKMVTDFDVKLGAVTSRMDALEGRLDELKSELDAALEDAEGEDEDDAEDEAEAEDEGEEDEGADVTADDIDCNKTYKQFASMDADQQKAVLVQAMADSGIKSIQARTIRKDANAALAVAEVMCSDKFGWDVDDFLKD